VKRLLFLLLSILVSSSFAQEFKTFERERSKSIKLMKHIGNNDFVIIYEDKGLIFFTTLNAYRKQYSAETKNLKKTSFQNEEITINGLKVETYNIRAIADLLDKGKCFIYDTVNNKSVNSIERKKYKYRWGPRAGGGGRIYHIDAQKVLAISDYKI
jgi:hypothetical protein